MGILGRRILQMVVTVGAMLLVASAWSGLTVASAQEAASDLDITEASAFVGDWTLSMNGGTLDMRLSVKDVGGKAAAQISSDIAADQMITKISRSGDKLVLSYESDFEGQAFDVVVTLTPNGDNLDVTIDFAGGQFVMDGTGTK